MTIATIEDVEFGAELPPFEPDTSLVATGAFADAVGWGGPPGSRTTTRRGRRACLERWYPESWHLAF